MGCGAQTSAARVMPPGLGAVALIACAVTVFALAARPAG
jgi:hypothetical protein